MTATTLPAWTAQPRPVQALLCSEWLGLLATACTQLTLAWWIGHQGGAAALARYGAVTGLAALLATPLLSPAGDRWPKARLVRLGRLCQLADALLLVALAQAGVFDLALLCACSLLSVAALALSTPAQAGLLPELVDASGLPATLRLHRSAQAAGGWFGPLLGGAALAGLGVPAAMGLAAILHGVAAAAVWRLRPAPSVAAAPRSGWWHEMAQGVRAKWRVRLDRWWTLVGALMMMCLLPATGLLLPLHLQALGLGAGWFGICQAALSAGLLLGMAGFAPALVQRLGRVRALALVLGACTAALAGMGLCRQPLPLAALFMLTGACMSVTQLVGQTHRLLATPQAYRARMSAVHLTVAHGAASLAPALAGALLQHVQVPRAYTLLAAGFGAASLLLLAIPGLGDFLRQDHEGVRDWYARHYPHAFGQR